MDLRLAFQVPVDSEPEGSTFVPSYNQFLRFKNRAWNSNTKVCFLHLVAKKKEGGGPRLSKNAEQIEALLKRINEENKRTKEVLDNIQKSENQQQQQGGQQNSLKALKNSSEVKALATAVIPPVRTKIIEKTSTTFLDAYQLPRGINNNVNNNNNNNNSMKNNNNNNDGENPLVTYETSGEGKKVPIVIYNCNYLSQVNCL